jgi:hypothetical protein
MRRTRSPPAPSTDARRPQRCVPRIAGGCRDPRVLGAVQRRRTGGGTAHARLADRWNPLVSRGRHPLVVRHRAARSETLAIDLRCARESPLGDGAAPRPGAGLHRPAPGANPPLPRIAEAAWPLKATSRQSGWSSDRLTRHPARGCSGRGPRPRGSCSGAPERSRRRCRSSSSMPRWRGSSGPRAPSPRPCAGAGPRCPARGCS